MASLVTAVFTFFASGLLVCDTFCHKSILAFEIPRAHGLSRYRRHIGKNQCNEICNVHRSSAPQGGCHSAVWLEVLVGMSPWHMHHTPQFSHSRAVVLVTNIPTMTTFLWWIPPLHRLVPDLVNNAVHKLLLRMPVCLCKSISGSVEMTNKASHCV